MTELRKKINQEFIIRVGNANNNNTILVGFQKFCQIIGKNLQAQRIATKALRCKKEKFQVKLRRGITITFSPR